MPGHEVVLPEGLGLGHHVRSLSRLVPVGLEGRVAHKKRGLLYL